MFELRDYQKLAHEMIIAGFLKKLRLLLLMSTGSGKSKTAVAFIKKFEKHFIFILIVRRRGLVTQLEDDLKLFGLDYGVFMAGHDLFNPEKNNQACSIDTLSNRELPHLESKKDIVLIIDEADESNAPSYQEVINTYMARTSSRTFLLGLTATAYDYALPHFDEALVPVTAKQLRANKSLVEYRYFIPAQKDFSEIKIEKGEFNPKDVDRVFNSPKAIIDDFKLWQQYGEDRQTLIFCTSQNHARNFSDYINKLYGYRIAQWVDATTEDDIRLQVYKEFKNKEIKFLVNVRLITRGVDIPEIGCILDSAPTLSINLHIQKLGRGSRPNPYYSDCIVIDTANNLVNNGSFYKDRIVNLKSSRKFSRAQLGEQMRVCKSCFRGADPSEFGTKNTCPFCGFFNGKIPKKKISKAKQKELFLQNATDDQIEQLEMIKDFRKILWQFQNLGKRYSKDISIDKAHNKMIEKYGREKVMKIKNAIGLRS